jgi:hypothetical protein
LKSWIYAWFRILRVAFISMQRPDLAPMSSFHRRSKDVSESFHLLLELLTSEPFLQECFQMVENMCLSRDIEFTVSGGQPPALDFKSFINRHYYSFLSNAMRQAQGLGFVVWCVRRLPSGDSVPEVLPLGSFTWVVEPDPTGRHSLRYKVHLVGIKEVDFVLTEWIQPNLNVNENSILHATVQTPLAHLIEEYRILRETMKRYHHADAWNTTARIMVSSDPKQFNHEASQREVFETLDFLKEAVETRRRHTASAVEEAFQSRQSNHREVVYELPPHHRIEPTPVLKPVVDMEFVTNKFRSSVCSLLGIPSEMVLADKGASGQESRGGRSTSRIFQGKMARMCFFLSQLLQEVYRKIYKGEAEFHLVALPRLEVQGIEDLKTLHEIGVLQPDHALKLSDILLGATRGNPRKRGRGDEKQGDTTTKSNARGKRGEDVL